MSLEAEQAVLGSIIKKADLLDECFLRKEEFIFDDRNSVVFEVLKYSMEHFESVDMVVMAQNWGERLAKIGGISYLMQLQSSVPSISNFDHYQNLIRNDYIREQARAYVGHLQHEGDIDTTAVIAEMERLNDLKVSTESGPVRMSSLLTDHTKVILKRAERADGITGSKTASEVFDKMSGGQQKGDLVIVGARPSMGKTQYVLGECLNAALGGWCVCFFSAEMSGIQIVERLICQISGIDNNKIRSGLMSDNDWSSYEKAIDIIESLNLYIDDEPGMTVEYIDRETKKLRKKYKNVLIAVDYLQQIGTEKNFSKNNEKASYISSSLKKSARKNDVPVIAITSIGRKCDERQDKRPMMSDIKESGDIEYDVDVAIFIYRDDYYYPNTALKGTSEIIVAKGRNIGTGTIRMFFNKKNGRFTDLTEDELYELDKKVKEYEQQKNRR